MRNTTHTTSRKSMKAHTRILATVRLYSCSIPWQVFFGILSLSLGIPFLAIIKQSYWVPTQHIPALSSAISFLTDEKVRHKRGEGSYPRSPSRLLEEPGIEPTSLESWFSPLARTPYCLLLQSNILRSLATLFTIPA